MSDCMKCDFGYGECTCGNEAAALEQIPSSDLLESRLQYALDTIALIDRECSLCHPYIKLPDRVQKLINDRERDSNSVLSATQSRTNGGKQQQRKGE